MTMEDWAKHLHGILTSTGENLLIGNGTVSHLQVMNMKLEFEEEIMASSKEYLEFILGQLYELEEVSYRAMMGEFILYYKGKICLLYTSRCV